MLYTVQQHATIYSSKEKHMDSHHLHVAPLTTEFLLPSDEAVLFSDTAETKVSEIHVPGDTYSYTIHCTIQCSAVYVQYVLRLMLSTYLFLFSLSERPLL